MKFKYLVILLAVGSMLLLYLLSLFSQPMVIPLSSLSEYDGQHVIVHGVVTDQYTTTSGSQMISLKDPEQNTTSTVILYLEGETMVEYGDLIQAAGTVQQYKNQWELLINNPQDITILQKWNTQSFPLSQLAQNPEKYVNRNVNVTGTTDQLSSTSFYLQGSGKQAILVFYDASNPHEFSNGDTVSVAGRFLYNSETFQYVLRATDPQYGIYKTEE